MSPRIIPTLVLAFGLQTLCTTGAQAEQRKAPPTRSMPNRPGEKKTPTAPVHTTITTVSADSITIAEAKGSKTFKITKDTEIELKGQKAKAEDLKPGMRVSVNMGSDPEVASRISASDAPKEGSGGGGEKGNGGAAERKR